MKLTPRYLFDILRSLPKTVWFNFRYLPFDLALKLPFYIHYRTKIHIKDGFVKIERKAPLKTFMIKFGNMGSFGIVENHYNVFFVDHGSILFKGKAAFGVGSSIRSEGELIIGDNFNANRNSFISCTRKIEIGNNVLLGWNVSIRDSDGHMLIHNNIPQEPFAKVRIGDNVWICANAKILKGVNIGDHSVVAYQSLMIKGNSISGVLWAGTPAKIVKDNIDWSPDVKIQ